MRFGPKYKSKVKLISTFFVSLIANFHKWEFLFNIFHFLQNITHVQWGKMKDLTNIVPRLSPKKTTKSLCDTSKRVSLILVTYMSALGYIWAHFGYQCGCFGTYISFTLPHPGNQRRCIDAEMVYTSSNSYLRRVKKARAN